MSFGVWDGDSEAWDLDNDPWDICAESLSIGVVVGESLTRRPIIYQSLATPISVSDSLTPRGLSAASRGEAITVTDLPAGFVTALAQEAPGVILSVNEGAQIPAARASLSISVAMAMRLRQAAPPWAPDSPVSGAWVEEPAVPFDPWAKSSGKLTNWS